MKKTRIGKDIKISWTITTNGKPSSLEGRDLKLEMIPPNGSAIEMPIDVVGNNTIHSTFFGKDQKRLGIYKFTLWENYGKEGQTVVDKTNAFELVSNTDQECNRDERPKYCDYGSGVY